MTFAKAFCIAFWYIQCSNELDDLAKLRLLLLHLSVYILLYYKYKQHICQQLTRILYLSLYQYFRIQYAVVGFEFM